jgi:VCBS repeat-containing protein
VSSAATHGSASVDGSGKWTYTVSDTDAVDALAAGEQLSDSFTVKVDDGHDGTATQVVNIDITGTNDDPFITSAAQSGIVSEGDPLHGANMSATGQVTFSDVDLSDTHTLSVSSNPAYGTASVNDAGNWSYTVADAGAVDALAVGQHLTDHFRVQVDDHHGGFATQAVSIDILGTNDAPVITSGGGGGSANVSVPENSTNVTNVDADDPDTGALLTYQILQTLGTDFAAFEIDSSSGVLKFAPDFEKTPGNTYVVDVQVKDDAGATDTQSIAVTLTGSHAVIANDDIVLTNLPQGADILIPASALLANDTGAPSFPLHVESAANAENNDVVSLSSGDVTYVDNAPLNGSFDYTASDGQVESAFAHVTVVTQTQVGVVQGTAESEILIAGGDDDFLQGFEGNDFLSGGAGNDSLFGDAGCDTLVGGAGDDFLSGDGGSDTFDYNALSDAGTAGDLIFDFQQGTDHLDLRDLMSSIGAPHDNTAAFDNGYVRFTNGSGTALVEVDSNGGSDSFVTLATVVTDAPLTQADFIL